jgi:hypothetical protein
VFAQKSRGSSLGGGRLEGPFVRNGGEVAENESMQYHRFVNPEVVSDKSNALVFALSLFIIKQITTSQERFLVPVADINPVDCGSLIVSVHNHTLVNPLNIRTEGLGP